MGILLIKDQQEKAPYTFLRLDLHVQAKPIPQITTCEFSQSIIQRLMLTFKRYKLYKITMQSH